MHVQILVVSIIAARRPREICRYNTIGEDREIERYK